MSARKQSERFSKFNISYIGRLWADGSPVFRPATAAAETSEEEKPGRAARGGCPSASGRSVSLFTHFLRPKVTLLRFLFSLSFFVFLSSPVGGSEQLRATNVLHKVLKKDEDPMVHRHLFPFMKDACGEGTSNMRDRQMLCAISHTSSPCQADSGGPLFVWTKLKAKNKTSSMSLWVFDFDRSKWACQLNSHFFFSYQIGVLSGILPKKVTAVVPRCGKGNYLTYTKTRPLFDWLTEHTNETCKLEINPKDLDKVDWFARTRNGLVNYGIQLNKTRLKVCWFQPFLTSGLLNRQKFWLKAFVICVKNSSIVAD